MKRRPTANTGFLLFCTLIAIAFLPELFTYMTHVTYGSHKTLGRYQIAVPMSWWARTDEGGMTLALSNHSGWLRKTVFGGRTSAISFSIEHRSAKAASLENLSALDRGDKLIGGVHTEYSERSIAGQEVVCLRR